MNDLPAQKLVLQEKEKMGVYFLPYRCSYPWTVGRNEASGRKAEKTDWEHHGLKRATPQQADLNGWHQRDAFLGQD